MTSWFDEYKDVIAGIAGIATAIGLLATAVALGLAAIQVRQQRRLSSAQAIYEVQRDARDAAWRLVDDAVLAKAVFGEAPDKANVAIGTSINFYAAAFQVWKHGVMDDGMWNLLASELVRMLENEKPKQRWSILKPGYDPKFVEDIDHRVAGDVAKNTRIGKILRILRIKNQES